MASHAVSRDPFRALADATRRALLDQLRERDGQSLGELGASTAMARQSLTQHLDELRDAGLVTVVRRGRLRLHYLNPGPLHEIAGRWISSFDRQRLDAISSVKDRAEEQRRERDMPQTVPDYVYVTYIAASPTEVWHALTDADVTAEYWRHRNVSDWRTGSTWEHRSLETGEPDIAGRVVLSEPPSRLVITFAAPEDAESPTASVVTFELSGTSSLTRLSVVHERLPDSGMYAGISRGWPVVLANLKSLLETGSVLPETLWAEVDHG